MNVTPETVAELRRLHVEFTAADLRWLQSMDQAFDRREIDACGAASNEAERVLSEMWIGHGPSVLDELEAVRAEVADLKLQNLGLRQSCLAGTNMVDFYKADRDRLQKALAAAEAEARRYAESYPQSSDGRNTFVMLADRIAELGAAP